MKRKATKKGTSFSAVFVVQKCSFTHSHMLSLTCSAVKKGIQTPNSTKPKLWMVSCSVSETDEGWLSQRFLKRRTDQPVPGRCSKTRCWSMLVPHVRNASSMCWHATFNLDWTCFIYRTIILQPVLHPAAVWSLTCCSVFDPDRALWSGMMPRAQVLISNFLPSLCSWCRPHQLSSNMDKKQSMAACLPAAPCSSPFTRVKLHSHLACDASSGMC